MKKIALLLLPILVMVFTYTADAQIPNTLPIQGQLFQTNGMPVSDGEHIVTVTMFDTPTGGDGRVMCSACAVDFKDGVFQIVLGKDGNPEIERLEGDVYLELSVDGETLAPRIQLETVPFAHEASHAVKARNGVPVGSIIAMASNNAPPDYLVADGQALSSGRYPELFEAIGSTWGTGGDDGTDETDFNIPDLRGLFLRGDDMGSGSDLHLENRSFRSPPEDPTATVGSYQFNDDFPVEEGFGRYQDGDDIILRKRPGRTKYSGVSMVNAGTHAPNAAVVYMIKVR